MPPAHRTTRTAVSVMCGLAAVEITHVLLLDHDFTHSAVAIAIIVLLSSVQLFYFSRPDAPLRFPIGPLALTGQVALVFVPVFVFHQSWIALPGLLAGSALLVLPDAAGRVACALAVAAAGAAQAATGGDATAVLFGVVAAALTGLVVHGLPWLATLATRLAESRTELALCAVADERMRVSRDLHDLLGYGLSAIKLKSELVHRLLPDQPERARESVAEIIDITRLTLVDVRSVALGYRLLSVRDAVTSAKAVLASADIEVRMELDDRPVPEPAATVLATLVREGVTNVLRHSKAENCEISVRRCGRLVLLDIVNDGVGDEVRDRSGSGVRNMTERVREIGGEVSARHVGGDRFHLHASIPLDLAVEAVGKAEEELAGQGPAGS
jgi:two-component system, NarL family, sensor histidine kinase DesK